MGCISPREKDDVSIQQKELSLQIILCTIEDIKSGFFYLNEGESISRPQIKQGFENMQNILSAAIAKTESCQKLLDKFVIPYKNEKDENFNFKDLLIAFYMNSRTNTLEKAQNIAQLLYRDKEVLTQDDVVALFKRVFKSVMSYSYALIDKFTQEEKDFDKPKKEEKKEDEKAESEQALLLHTGQHIAKLIGESLVGAKETIPVADFAEKCKTYIPDRFYRDIFYPKALRAIVYREYDNLDKVDRERDEKK